MLSVSIERKVYTLKTEIGNGAAACVYLAECEGRDYALKEIKGYHEMRIKKMVDREIYTQKRLCNQPHIVNIVGSEAIDNVMWIVFELG